MVSQRLVLILTDAHNKIVLDYHEELALDPLLSLKLERVRERSTKTSATGTFPAFLVACANAPPNHRHGFLDVSSC